MRSASLASLPADLDEGCGDAPGLQNGQCNRASSARRGSHEPDRPSGVNVNVLIATAARTLQASRQPSSCSRQGVEARCWWRRPRARRLAVLHRHSARTRYGAASAGPPPLMTGPAPARHYRRSAELDAALLAWRTGTITGQLAEAAKRRATLTSGSGIDDVNADAVAACHWRAGRRRLGRRGWWLTAGQRACSPLVRLR